MNPGNAKRRPLPGTALQSIAAGDTPSVPRTDDNATTLACECDACQVLPITWRPPRGDAAPWLLNGDPDGAA